MRAEAAMPEARRARRVVEGTGERVIGRSWSRPSLHPVALQDRIFLADLLFYRHVSMSKHHSDHELQVRKLRTWYQIFHLEEEIIHFASVLLKKARGAADRFPP